MQKLVFLMLSLSFVFLSCKKEQTPEDELNQMTSDQYISKITASRLKSTLAHDCHDNSFTLAEQYRSSFEYRFVQGTQINNNYFYKIEKRYIESFLSQTGFEPSWSDTSAWVEQTIYYRYSFNDNKSYLYASLNDPNPTLIFDFNVNIGDTVNIASHITNYDQFVEVLDVSYENINNLNYPIIHCKLVSCLNCYLTISPDLPNPYAFEAVDLHVELNDSSNVPTCIQTTGISYNRSAYSYNGQWIYSLQN